MQVDLQLGGIEASLEKFSEKIKTTVIRAGSQAAAQVFYNEAKNRVPVKSGTLKNSIYQVFSEDNSDKTKATYHVSWNRSKAPHGHLIEFGTSRAPAHPFLKPAYEAVKKDAYDAAIAKMKESL